MQDKSKKPTTKDSTSGDLPTKDTNDIISKIVEKIVKVDNILVALSKNPSVDELAAALGLTLFLDGVNKHATAIFSGKTPNALEFLKPEDTFETNTNSLQDFIIALNKDKADHLRYKLDGDYVKVFITPYKTTLSEEDLEFSHGDFNVNLIIALNVPTVDDLDGALYEHGRIMHDATSINITTGVPGKFGEIEWSDPSASSISEMAVRLTSAMHDQAGPINKDVATAFLTGIVAATERFSNDKTTPATMSVASRLMEAGANQTLVSENVMKSGVATSNKIDATEAVAKGASADLGTMDLHHSFNGNRTVSTQSGPAHSAPSKITPPPKPAEDPSVFRLNKDDKKSVTTPQTNVTQATPSQTTPAPSQPNSTLKVETGAKVAPAPSTSSSDSSKTNTSNTSSASNTSSISGTSPENTPLPEDETLDNLKKDIAAAVKAGKNPAAMMAPEIVELPATDTDAPNLNYPQDDKEAPSVTPPLVHSDKNITPPVAQSTPESTSQPTPQPTEQVALQSAPETTSGSAPSLDMPLPTDSELPPPPAPPINFDSGSMGAVDYPFSAPPTSSQPAPAPAGSPDVAPQVSAPVAPSASLSTGASPSLPPVQINQPSTPTPSQASPAPSAPNAPSQPAVPVPAQSTSDTPDAPTQPASTDPSAFKIPGM